MALQSATFNRTEVALHLNRTFPYAATLFSQDTLSAGDRIPSPAVEKWFRSYFPSEVAAAEYRRLEACCTQFIEELA